MREVGYPPKPTKYVVYAYPIFKRVSFSVIGEKHVEQLRKYFRVTSIDERAVPYAHFVSKPLMLMQPYFYPLGWMGPRFVNVLNRVDGLIGVDVADSDRLSEKAVKQTNYADALIVPSEYSRRAYVNSGVKKPVHVVPHGVDEWWITHERKKPNLFQQYQKLKEERGYKILLSFVPHSPHRKGMDILVKTYEELLRERRDVLMVVKTGWWTGILPQDIKYIPADDQEKTFPIYARMMQHKVSKKWLREEELLELFDLADIYIVAARGGGFEHDGLKALARGVPTIGARGGSWQEYMPEWGLVDSKPCPRALIPSDIHVGRGVEMIVDKAVDKIHDILDNLDDYKARAREYRDEVIRRDYTWDAIGLKLRDVVARYM